MITTPEQLVLLEADEGEEAGVSTRPHDEDTAEVLNYVRAMQHGLSRLLTLPVSLPLIREVHQGAANNVHKLEDCRGRPWAPTIGGRLGRDGDKPIP